MGLTCKPWGKTKSIFQKLDNQILQEVTLNKKKNKFIATEKIHKHDEVQ